MRYLSVEPRSNDRGSIDYVVVGSDDAYFWLANAAGNARNGLVGNSAEFTDGSGHRLVLEPERPAGIRGGPTSRLEARSPLTGSLTPAADTMALAEAPRLEIPRERFEHDRAAALSLIGQFLETHDEGFAQIVVRGKLEGAEAPVGEQDAEAALAPAEGTGAPPTEA